MFHGAVWIDFVMQSGATQRYVIRTGSSMTDPQYSFAADYRSRPALLRTLRHRHACPTEGRAGGSLRERLDVRR
jgi:hypothetical protein